MRVGFSKTTPDYTTMLPPIQEHIEKFLELRTQHLTVETLFLFPAIKGPKIQKDAEQLSSNHIRKMFVEIGEVVGLDIAPKDLRTSYGQVLMDWGAGIETTSRMLRHASVATTQQWYVELRPDDSFEKLQELFTNPPDKFNKHPKELEGYR